MVQGGGACSGPAPTRVMLLGRLPEGKRLDLPMAAQRALRWTLANPTSLKRGRRRSGWQEHSRSMRGWSAAAEHLRGDGVGHVRGPDRKGTRRDPPRSSSMAPCRRSLNRQRLTSPPCSRGSLRMRVRAERLAALFLSPRAM